MNVHIPNSPLKLGKISVRHFFYFLATLLLTLTTFVKLQAALFTHAKHKQWSCNLSQNRCCCCEVLWRKAALMCSWSFLIVQHNLEMLCLQQHFQLRIVLLLHTSPFGALIHIYDPQQCQYIQRNMVPVWKIVAQLVYIKHWILFHRCF